MVPVALNDDIYGMEGIEKMKTLYNKPCVSKKKGVMDTFRYKHMKKARISE